MSLVSTPAGAQEFHGAERVAQRGYQLEQLHHAAQRGRMLYMSSTIAASAVNTNRTKVVGTGLTLKSTIDRDVLGLSAEAAAEWQRKTEAEFKLWTSKKENCDAIGVNNFEGLQQLALKSWLMSGDVFALIKDT
jgi:capsid protein